MSKSNGIEREKKKKKTDVRVAQCSIYWILVLFHLFPRQGFFCPAGSSYPQACPTGTYGNSTLLRRSEDCTPCPGGYYCEGAGNLEPTDVCDAGFYCSWKAVSSVRRLLNPLSTRPHQNVVWYNNSWLGFLKILNYVPKEREKFSA